jgi:hypothetical protein
MRKKLTAVAALAASTVTLAAVAAAGPVAAKQRIVIQLKEGAPFVLTPVTSGALKPDTGSSSFCCWTQRSIVRNGQAVEINDPQMTLTGKRGTIVARNRIGFVDLTDGRSSPAPGESSAARVPMRGSSAEGSQPASRSPTAIRRLSTKASSARNSEAGCFAAA